MLPVFGSKHLFAQNRLNRFVTFAEKNRGKCHPFSDPNISLQRIHWSYLQIKIGGNAAHFWMHAFLSRVSIGHICR